MNAKEELRYKLNELLISECNNLCVPLSYVDEFDDDNGGRILYILEGNKIKEPEIQILNQFKGNPFLLAHELGHYIELSRTGKSTERGADTEAKKLCEYLLIPEDVKELSRELYIYFQRDWLTGYRKE